MRTVVIHIRKGPLEGTELQLELGHVVLGREPGPGGILLSGDQRISRRHGELFEQDGQLVFRNLSPNGTQVNREWVRDQQMLRPGAELRLGERTQLELRFEAPEPTSVLTEVVSEGEGPPNRGLLTQAWVRALLLAYLFSLAALAVFLQARSAVGGDFVPVRQDYEAYRPVGTSQVILSQRLARAERLVRELVAYERREQWAGARAVCRELMALDSDPASPIYRFAARRLGELVDKGEDG